MLRAPGSDQLDVEVLHTRRLRFDDGSPVTSASAITSLGEGWLVAQDDANHGAWVRPGRPTTTVRLFAASDEGGLDRFSEQAGTKHLKPDIEAACSVVVAGRPAALLLGSGSTGQRRRGVLVTLQDATPVVSVAELGPLYSMVGRVLGISDDLVNLEGATVVGNELHWFNRGNAGQGLASSSVVVDLEHLLARWPQVGDAPPVRRGTIYDLADGLAVTDAVALDGELQLLAVAAEDTPNAYDDGPVLAAGLALVDGSAVRSVCLLPPVDGAIPKVEGLAVVSRDGRTATLLAVVDADAPDEASLELTLNVQW